MEIPESTTTRKNIVFYDNEEKLLKHLKKQKNQGAYIKSLIKEDMKKGNKSTDVDSVINSKEFDKKINSIIEKRVKKEVEKYIEIINKCYNISEQNK